MNKAARYEPRATFEVHSKDATLHGNPLNDRACRVEFVVHNFNSIIKTIYFAY